MLHHELKRLHVFYVCKCLFVVFLLYMKYIVAHEDNLHQQTARYQIHSAKGGLYAIAISFCLSVSVCPFVRLSSETRRPTVKREFREQDASRIWRLDEIRESFPP